MLDAMTTSRPLDDIDREILALLRENGRRTVKDIAERVGLSTAPVNRRIERLEKTGVILGYSARIAQIGPSIEAFTELRYTGSMDQEEILAHLTRIPEVQGAYSMAGDTDALVHIRADDVNHLQRVISKIRKQPNLVSSRTLIVLNKRLGMRRMAPGDDGAHADG